MEGHTDLSRLDDTLIAIRYQDEILGPIVRAYVGAVGPRFLLVQGNRTECMQAPLAYCFSPSDIARLDVRLSKSSVVPWSTSRKKYPRTP